MNTKKKLSISFLLTALLITTCACLFQQSQTLYVDLDIEYNGPPIIKAGSQSVIFSGEAYSMSGSLSEDEVSYTWSSDRDGILDHDKNLFVKAIDLSEGLHTLTLTARTKDGKSGSTSIQVMIYRHFSSLSTDATPLNFVANQGSITTPAQFPLIWHLGDHSLTWSASADQSWIVLDATSGITPSGIGISANPSGLPVGTFTGTVTITSNAEGTNTSTIKVNLEIK